MLNYACFESIPAKILHRLSKLHYGLIIIVITINLGFQEFSVANAVSKPILVIGFV